MEDPRPLPVQPTANGGAAPIEVSARPSAKRSFWSRIALRRDPAPSEKSAGPGPSNETIASRLGAIEEKLGGVEASIDLASERLETRLLQFWEIEEQLGQVMRRLTELESTQHDLARRSARLSKTTTLLAVFSLVAAGAALAIAFPLGI